ncbi:FMN-binding protein [Lactobacillus sp. XV13L]|nr:FMN-binding protein [Lactobacillus sp. XV13L]
MKNNKFVYSAVTLALSALLLSACSTTASKDSSSSSSKPKVAVTKKKEGKQVAGAKLQDGTYKLVEDNYFNGYRVKMSMTVKGGKVTNTSYDYVDKNGKSKAQDKKYEAQMKKYSKAKIGPKEYIPALQKSFAANGANSSAIQVVSGATSSSTTMKNYVNQLTQAAQKGDTATIHINNGKKLKDGTYKLQELNYSHGYRQVYTMVVKGGKISSFKYDQVNKKGVSKTKNAGYEKQMKKVTKTGPKEYIPELEKEFLKANGNMEKVQVVSGATESSHSFIAYVDQLLNAAQKGDASTIKVDNIVYQE